ncbi:MAG TPA: hypothetical protein VGD50_03955 [Candidatus Baltobacteraceae bacterium]
MAPEHHHGRHGRHALLAGRALARGSRATRLLALALQVAILAPILTPMLAAPAGADAENGLVLPVTLSQTPASQFAQRGNLPVGTQAEFNSILYHHSCSPDGAAQVIAQAQAPSPTDTPTGTATDAPTSTPTSEPTPPPLPPPPPPLGPFGGIGKLSPPTATPSGGVVSAPPIPTPTPAPSVSLGPVYLTRPTGPPPTIVPKGEPSGSPSPSPSPTPAPQAVPTLGPNQYAVLADTLEGSTAPGIPGDAVGNVHIYYGDGVLVGERAHFNGDHTVTISGHPYVINRQQDTVLYAESIVFDTDTQKATLVGGRGATTQGVERGELFYSAKTLTSTRGTLHGDHGSFTTCLNQHRGYHIEARKFDLTPGQKLIAHDAVVFLGPLAIFFIPFVVIPLHQDAPLRRRSAPILPDMGYDEADGYYLKTRFGFGSSYYYYGDYRFEFYSKRGIGLGYDGTINRRDNKRQTQITIWTIKDRTNNDTRTSTLTLNDNENFSTNVHATVNGSYNNSFGPYVDQPAQLQLGANLNASGQHGSESLQFSSYTSGPQNGQSSLSYTQQLQLSSALREAFSLTKSETTNSGILDQTVHINTQTAYTTPSADYLFTVNRTDESLTEEVGYDTEPELQINPHINFHQFRFPFTTQFTYGYYREPQNDFSTERADILLNWPFTFTVFRTSLLSAAVNVHQDLYGTGDAKATVTQTASLDTPIGTHIVNSMQYNDAYPIGPSDVPFQLLDRIPSAYKQGQDTVSIFNSDIYILRVSGTTGFDRQAQPLSYQFNARPSLRSYIQLAGEWVPGSGNGFPTTNAQIMTPLGKSGDLQFVTDIDWKNKGRLENKSIYYRITIADCYQILTSYNDTAKAFNLGFNLLAFPDRGATIGVGGQAQTGGFLSNVEQGIQTNNGGFSL